MDRRTFLKVSGATASGAVAGCAGANAVSQADAQGPAVAPAVCDPVRPQTEAPAQQRYRIGYTTNTRGGWEGDPFKGMIEGREVGFRYMELFGASFCRPESLFYPNDAEGLMHRIFQIGVNFVSITGGRAGGATNFEDPAARADVIENHFEMARFSRKFGCMRQKTNMGRRRPEGTTQEDLRNMAETAEQLGRKMKNELGQLLGLHPHLNSQLQYEHELDYIMTHTSPEHVALVIDTGHFTMAGMDPVAQARKYASRVMEFHLKDTKPEDRGGTRTVPGPEIDQMVNPYFFPLGNGGVDFVALKAYLDSINWDGFLNVELDTSPWRPPKESARISATYIQNVLNIPL